MDFVWENDSPGGAGGNSVAWSDGRSGLFDVFGARVRDNASLPDNTGFPTAADLPTDERRALLTSEGGLVSCERFDPADGVNSWMEVSRSSSTVCVPDFTSSHLPESDAHSLNVH